MTNLALLGDIGGTNSRFGLMQLGTMEVRDDVYYVRVSPKNSRTASSETR